MDNNMKMMIFVCSLLLSCSCLYVLQKGVCAGDMPQTMLFMLLVAIVFGYVFYHIYKRLITTNNTNFETARQQMYYKLQQ